MPARPASPGSRTPRPARVARGRQQRVTARDRAHRSDQLDRLGVLDEEPARPDSQRLEDVLVEIERGEDHDADVGQPGSAVIAFVAASPSTPGMRMSISTTSGTSSRGERSASAPSPASPTTSMSSSCVEQRAQPAAHQLLDRRRAAPGSRATRPIGSPARTAKPAARAAARPRACRRRTRPLAHPGDPVAPGSAGRAAAASPTLVEHLDVNASPSARIRTTAPGVGVAGHVRERFLDDAERGEVDVAGQRRRDRAVDLDRTSTPAASVRATSSSSASRLGVGQPAARPRRPGAARRGSNAARPAPPCCAP